MVRVYLTVLALMLVLAQRGPAQEPPTGKPEDFKVKTCLHSVSYCGVWRGQAYLTVDEFLVKAKELGFDGVMLVAKRPHLSPLDYDEDARKRLRAKIEGLGLKLVCLAAYTDFTAGVDKPGIPHAEIQACYVGEVARLARDLGTGMVRIFTGYERPGVPFDKQYAQVVDGLRMAGKEAAKYGVTLAVQNHHDIGIHHDTMAWLLKEVNLPNVKAGFDAWAPSLQGLGPDEIRRAVHTMKPFLVHTIAADYVRLPRFRYEHALTNYLEEDALMRAVPMGEGVIDYETFFGALREIGYQGYIAYEMCEVLDGGGSIENLDRTARRFLDYVRKFERSGGTPGEGPRAARRPRSPTRRPGRPRPVVRRPPGNHPPPRPAWPQPGSRVPPSAGGVHDMRFPRRTLGLLLAGFWLVHAAPAVGEDWPQLKYDARRSGNVPERHVATPLGLVGAVPLTDAVLTSPVVAGGRVYVVDGSGVAFCLDAESLDVRWQVKTRGGPANVNNVSSPALAGGYLHFGTAAGLYYVLDAGRGTVVKEIACGEPILSAPVVSEGRVYFATLGSRVYALEPDGTVCWTWDFVKEVLGFAGDRWSGEQWLAHKKGRVTWRDTFCCSTDIACHGKTVVLSAGGKTLWLEDTGARPELRAVGLMPEYNGKEEAAGFGLSIGEEGEVYRQWHRRDNAGRVEVLRLKDGNVSTDFVPGTQTAISLAGLMSFCSVSVRGPDVYRCRPEQGFGFCRHAPGQAEPQSLGGYPSIVPPILLRDQGIVAGLDGRLYVVPLGGGAGGWSFQTAFGCPISAPPCVCDGRVYVGCEDGYLYVLGPGGSAPLPTKDLDVAKIRHPLASRLPDARYDWFTNHGDFANTNANDQGLRPPLVMKWIRRYEGTFKHVPVCGGGRLYTHTAEGQVIAVEQETGRLLWRRYWPDVYLSFTAPLYHRERLLLPQAGMKQSRLRCLDAATGRLLWEAPFTGSPSWSRQAPPVIHGNLAIYAFGSGVYAPQGSAKPFVFRGEPTEDSDGREVMSWIYTHDNPYYPKDNLPLIAAWDVETGREVWRRDFADVGTGGNDCGLCLMGGTLYYSTFFGYAAQWRGRPGPRGLTAALNPATGEVLWKTTDFYVTAGCTVSGRDGRLYLGGYNRPHGQTQDRHVWCLDARDGSLLWQSEPVRSAVNVISVGERYLFTNASGGDGHVLDRTTGKIVSRLNFGYACTRFTVSEPYVLGANMDMIDLSDGNRLAATGPAIDSRECIGAVVSNGRVFYTSQASGLQASLVYGEEAAAAKVPWFQPGPR